MKSLITFCFGLSSVFLSAQGLCPTTEFNGIATYYTASSTFSCSFETGVVNDHYAAINGAQANTADFCGTCLEITGQNGTTIVQVTDECSMCPVNNLDLSSIAFSEVVGDLSLGSGNITWKQISCPWATNLKLFTGTASNPWYCDVIIENHVNDLSLVEIFANGTWNDLTRTSYNSWTNNGFAINGEANYDFRITDIYGQSIEILNVDLGGMQNTYLATENFTPCSNLGFTTKLPEQFLLKDEIDQWVITLSNPIFSLQFVEQTGKILMSQNCNEKEVIVSKNNLTQGIYVLKIQQENGEVIFIKVMK